MPWYAELWNASKLTAFSLAGNVLNPASGHPHAPRTHLLMNRVTNLCAQKPELDASWTRD
jgi:hypothetical protein